METVQNSCIKRPLIAICLFHNCRNPHSIRANASSKVVWKSLPSIRAQGVLAPLLVWELETERSGSLPVRIASAHRRSPAWFRFAWLRSLMAKRSLPSR